jgi:predicted DNA binding protein
VSEQNVGQSGVGPDGEVVEECRLAVELELHLPESCHFHDRDAADVDLFVFDCTCHCTYRPESDEDRVYNVTRSTGPGCVCRPFCEYGCVPTVEAVRESTFVVSTHVPDRDVLRDLVDALKAVSPRVRLLRIVEEGGGGADDRSVSFDLTVLTDTQRETLELAVTHGYYDDPRGISMDELAAMLDVSKSALSRRLSTAEAKLVSELVHPM